MVLSNEAADFAQAIGFGEKLAASGRLDRASALPLAFAYFADGRYAKSPGAGPEDDRRRRRHAGEQPDNYGPGNPCPKSKLVASLH